MLLKVKTSEPRDALQSERTCLSFIRFSTTLFITSFGMLLNFKLDSSDAPTRNGSPIYSKILSYCLLGLSVMFLVFSGVSYYITINRYKMEKIHNFGFNNLVNSVLMSILMVVLVGVNIALLVEGYKKS